MWSSLPGPTHLMPGASWCDNHRCPHIASVPGGSPGVRALGWRGSSTGRSCCQCLQPVPSGDTACRFPPDERVVWVRDFTGRVESGLFCRPALDGICFLVMVNTVRHCVVSFLQRSGGLAPLKVMVTEPGEWRGWGETESWSAGRAGVGTSDRALRGRGRCPREAPGTERLGFFLPAESGVGGPRHSRQKDRLGCPATARSPGQSERGGRPAGPGGPRPRTLRSRRDTQ